MGRFLDRGEGGDSMMMVCCLAFAFLSAFAFFTTHAESDLHRRPAHRVDYRKDFAPRTHDHLEVTGNEFNDFVDPSRNDRSDYNSIQKCDEEGNTNGQTLSIVVETSSSSIRGPGQKSMGSITLDFGPRSTAARSTPGISLPIHGLPRIISSRLGGGERKLRLLRVEDKTRKKIETGKHCGAASALEAEAAGKVTMSVDLSDSESVLPLVFDALSNVMNAAVGTLRLLAPLIVARRALNVVGYICTDIIWNFPLDYLTGLYFRKTYTRLERAYLRYYELPSALRAFSRTSSQIFILIFLSGLVGWMYSLGQPPCREEARGLSLFCGILWIGAVVAAGHACSTAVSTWGGPLRLQVTSHPKNKKVFTRPSHILQWVQDLEEWTSMMSTHDEVKAFDPNPMIFPATWVPLRLLLIFAVARAFNTDPSSYRWCSSEVDQVPKLMKLFLIQLALGDEWHRVFLVEKRVGLGILVMFVYFVALAILIIASFTINGVAATLMIPMFLAVVVSGWMNVVIFVTRLEVNKKEDVAKALEKRKRAVIGTFKLGNNYYN